MHPALCQKIRKDEERPPEAPRRPDMLPLRAYFGRDATVSMWIVRHWPPKQED